MVSGKGLPTIGLDVGGVLLDRSLGADEASFFGTRPMDTPVMPGALEAVRTLAALFEGRILIVSRAGHRTRELSRRWLGLHGFLGDERIPPSHIYFVERRSEKAALCQALGVTHFVDDHLDVLSGMQIPFRILFRGAAVPAESDGFLSPGVVSCGDWAELLSLVRQTMHS